MAELAPVTPDGWRLNDAAFSWRFSRSSGAGGQHVNTTDSRVELIVDVGALGLPEHIATRVVAKLGEEIRIVSSTHRSQRRNRDDTIERLGAMIDAASKVQRSRRPTRPGKGAVERRITAKKHNAARKADRNWRAGE
ncbi:MAG: alternative ribosome rescue aminoacyl-tRNA hydrolase ArfB [Ilumatobacteraceae bacterium]